MAAFAAVIAVLLVAGQATIVSVAFPLGAVALGAWLFFRFPDHYVAFTLLLAIFAPETRRFVDYLSGWHVFSPITVTPLFVAALSSITPLRHLNSALRWRCFPFLLCAMGASYGFFVGIASNGMTAAVFGFAVWIIPIAFGWHMAIVGRGDGAWRAMEKALVGGMCIAGLYGIYQFFALPSWDAFWMENADIDSIGVPVPMLFRVFSTLNAPGPFSLFAMAALLIVCARPTWRHVAAGVPTLIAFLLSLVRSSWLGLMVGTVFLALRGTGRQRAGLVAALLLLPVVSLPLLARPAILDSVMPRFLTFENLSADESYQDREAFYDRLWPRALDHAGGVGFGVTGVATKLNNHGLMGQLGNFDSGVIEILFVLGLPGALLFFIGLGLLLAPALSLQRNMTASARVAAAIAVAMAVQLAGSNTIVGAQGLLFWSAAGMMMRAAYASERSRGNAAGARRGATTPIAMASE